MSKTLFMNSQGETIEVDPAPADGVYLDPAGVPRHMAEGDPIPPGWTVDPAGAAEGAKGRRKPAVDKAKKAPAEDK